jgi:hypothetical protein
MPIAPEHDPDPGHPRPPLAAADDAAGQLLAAMLAASGLTEPAEAALAETG